MSFSWSKKELNDEQSEAVRQKGSVFLIACPGSGKTRTLTYKVAYELSQLRSRRQFVVAITYTNRAANEITERIDALGVDTSQLWIGTIHSFCLEWILRPYGIYSPELAHGFHVIDEYEQERLFERLSNAYVSPRIRTFDCNYFVTPTNYQIGCPDARKHTSVHAILTEYFSFLASNRQIDYELILWHAHRLIEANPLICDALAKLFPILLVDEYQDTKEVQYRILASVVRAGAGRTRSFIVGDPNQAIYGSLGGYAIELDDWQRITGVTSTSMKLTHNYRSSSRLVDYFGKFNAYKTEIQASGDFRDHPSLITYNHQISRDDLTSEIAKLIRYNVETNGIPQNEICVLAPWWVHLATMTRKLSTLVPEYQFDGPGLAPFARDFENFWYRLARVCLTEPSPELYLRRMRWAGEVLEMLANAGVNRPWLDKTELLKICNSIQSSEQDGLKHLEIWFDAVFTRIGVDFRAFPILKAHHTAFFDGAAKRIQQLEKEGVSGARDLIFYRKTFHPRHGITVSTIHGAKGAEFDVVIAYALLEGMVPHFNDQNGPLSAQKLLYVVGSRARKNLHLFSESGRPRGAGYGSYQATEVLARCSFHYDLIQ